MYDAKMEIIDNVMLAMTGHIDNPTMDMLKYALEGELEKVNVEKISTLPALTQESVDEQNAYYIKLMTLRKRNLAQRTIEAYTSAVVRLITLVDKPLTEIDSLDIDRYIQWYEYRNVGKKNQATTCNNERRYLSAFFSWMRKEGFIVSNPVENTEEIKETQKPIDYFKPRQLEELREGCNNRRDRALIEVLRSTGARIGEIVGINKTDIDWSNGDVLILSEKSNKYRTLYLDESSRYYLKEYLDSRTDDNEALFVWLIKPYNRLTAEGIEYAMKQVGKRIKAQYRVYPHKMRKTLGMKLRNSGVDVGSIQEILGHASPDTTMRYYAQSTPETLRDIRKKFA